MGLGVAPREYQELELNGLKPFPTLPEALSIQRMFERRIAQGRLSVKCLRMNVAESKEDHHVLKHARGLIVLVPDPRDPNHNLLLGPRVADRPHYIDCAGRIKDTHLQTFTAFADATHAAAEVARQAQTPAHIASFALDAIS